MKVVYFIRHAKSSWEDLEIPDHRRDLLPVGRKRTKKIGQWLLQRRVSPDLIISSPATRAHKTAEILAHELSFPEDKIITAPTLYPGSREHMMDTLYPLPDSMQHIIIVGHNPTLTDVVNSFLGNRQKIFNLPTSAVAAVQFHTDKWQDVELASTEVEYIIAPKDLKSKKK